MGRILNTLRPRQDGRHFPDDIFKRIFLNENVWTLTKISPRFVPRGPVYNIPALVQIMAWRLPGDKPLSEPMMACLLTHICVTRPQWVKTHQNCYVGKPEYIFDLFLSLCFGRAMNYWHSDHLHSNPVLSVGYLIYHKDTDLVWLYWRKLVYDVLWFCLYGVLSCSLTYQA